MRRNLLKKLLPIVVLAILGLSVSSCNRGMGCPSNFSAKAVVSQLSHSISYAMLK
jgi:hypothetical protein